MWAGVWLGVVHGTLGRVVMCLGVELEDKVVACSGRVNMGASDMSKSLWLCDFFFSFAVWG